MAEHICLALSVAVHRYAHCPGGASGGCAANEKFVVVGAEAGAGCVERRVEGGVAEGTAVTHNDRIARVAAAGKFGII